MPVLPGARKAGRLIGLGTQGWRPEGGRSFLCFVFGQVFLLWGLNLTSVAMGEMQYVFIFYCCINALLCVFEVPPADVLCFWFALTILALASAFSILINHRRGGLSEGARSWIFSWTPRNPRFEGQ